MSFGHIMSPLLCSELPQKLAEPNASTDDRAHPERFGWPCPSPALPVPSRNLLWPPLADLYSGKDPITPDRESVGIEQATIGEALRQSLTYLFNKYLLLLLLLLLAGDWSCLGDVPPAVGLLLLSKKKPAKVFCVPWQNTLDCNV